MTAFESWVGRTECADDTVAAMPVAALAATLDVDAPRDAMPPLWHWIFFTPKARASEIDPDGHPRRGGFLPPVPLPRRMWAGGRLSWHEPLRVGDAVTRTSRIERISERQGRSGTLVFVTVRHEIAGPRGLALTEEHDIVYRDAPREGDAAPPAQAAPTDERFSREIVPDPVLLFRYSALTFNGHRIHYDRSYVTEVEGYPGLVVHGPLIATLLMQLARSERPGLVARRFEFKAVHPVFDIHRFHVCGRDEGPGRFALWARDHQGRLAMQATLDFSE
ncbi:FAS1-like dehydratase domain-containing protein [Piscinibacter sp.]|uniref:FAS1-like dehydratase domain-containing protein n=1 Tax=Piscinibacter sp. TaxID=1903157 RepID=UPI002BE5E144|nr:MaoC family dehydratase N-terminal domain-containing protein [Albitalea sp.]HUG25035.1 MaoC family dehydratase N-terminal domain-containing protein [Albitalea sp.]